MLYMVWGIFRFQLYFSKGSQKELIPGDAGNVLSPASTVEVSFFEPSVKFGRSPEVFFMKKISFKIFLSLKGF